MHLPATPRSRAVLGLAVLVLLGLVLVVLAVAGPDDEDRPRLTYGAAAAGFPLRGDGAGDRATIGEAADAWVRRGRREERYWATREHPEVTVLWAGRIAGDTDAVVLAADRSAAVLQRLRGRDSWEISDASIERDDDPRIVVAEDAVLLGVRSSGRFRAAQAEGAGSPPAPRPQDGLWHRGGTRLTAGALLLADGVPGRYVPAGGDPAAVFTGRDPVLRRLSPALLRRMTYGSESTVSPAAQRLGAAARAAGEQADDDRAGRDDRTALPSRAPLLDVVADRELAPLGPVLVLSVRAASESSPDAVRDEVVAAFGGDATAGGDEAVAVGLAGREDGRRATDGPALGAAYVRRGDEDAAAYLLVAGDRSVVRSSVLTGGRTLPVDAPVGLVRAPWADADVDDGPAWADVAIVGRTAGGDVVVPAAVPRSVVAVDAD